MLNKEDAEFLSGCFFNSYMADGMNESEVRRACAILSITFPPQQHKGATNEHSNTYTWKLGDWKINQLAQPRPSQNTVNPVH